MIDDVPFSVDQRVTVLAPGTDLAELLRGMNVGDSIFAPAKLSWSRLWAIKSIIGLLGRIQKRKYLAQNMPEGITWWRVA